ncbi:MAG: hypothetical protein P4M00_18900 [Azospirillaceae bacterium]|nr:hypothetical protein [Azospirillaceae bacterium]
MNILFYIEPWIEKNKPEWKNIWIDNVIFPLYQTIRGFSKNRCFFLIGDAQSGAVNRITSHENTQCSIISQRELRDIFPDYLTATLSWYRGDATFEEMEKMKGIIRQKVDGFIPDIIITFMASVPFLSELFPDALVLTMEVSGFSRAPYPSSWFLDPCGSFKHSFLVKYAAALTNREISEDGRKFLHFFRKKFLDRLLIAKNPFSRSELIQDKPFRYLLLLPLQVSDYVAFEGNTSFASQWDMLCHVLDNIRPDIGVVVTEHSDWSSILTPEVNTYLRKTYPNYIYLEKFGDYQYSSQFLMQHVDAVATVSSTLGFQGLLWEKPICALGDSHINVIADIKNIHDLGDCLDSKSYQSKDNILYYLLSHFFFIGDKQHLYDSTWLEQRFVAWIARYRTVGIDENFFAPIDTPFRLLKSYLRSAYPHIPYSSRNGLDRNALVSEAVLVERTADLEATRADLVARTEEANAARAVLVERTADLEATRAALVARTDEANAARAVLVERTADLEATRADLLARTEEANAARAALVERTADLEATRADLVARTEEANAARAALVERTADLEATRADLVARTEEANAARAALIERTADLEATRADLVSRTDEADAARAALTELTADLEATRVDLVGRTDEANVARAALVERTADLEATRADLEATRAVLVSRTDEADAARAALTELTADLEATRVDLVGRTDEANTARAALLERTADLEATRAALVSRTDEANVARAALVERTADLEATRAALVARTEEANVARVTLIERNADLEATRAALEATRADLLSRTDEANVARAALIERTADLDATRADLLSRTDEANAARAALIDHVDELIATRRELAERTARLEALSKRFRFGFHLNSVSKIPKLIKRVLERR